MKFVCLKYPRLDMTYKADAKIIVNNEVVKTPREVIKFEDGYYTTDDPKRIEFIKRHVDFGNGNICVDESESIQEPTPEEMKIIEPHKRGRPKKA